MTKPPFKAVGGKTKLVPELLKLMPDHCDTYYEPFVGGGALFWAMAEEKRFNRAVLGDKNKELIHTYISIKAFPRALIKTLENRVISKAEFERIRSLAPFPEDGSFSIQTAARFIYLNKTCFNGLYRVNRKGQFNVPYGKWTTPPKLYDEENIRSCSKLLDGVILKHDDFLETTKDAKPGDVVYFDPPYIPLNETSNFTNYTQDGFNLKDQERLSLHFALLAIKGVKVILSNSDTELTREFYKKFNIIEIEAARSINCKGNKRGKIRELIITAN